MKSWESWKMSNTVPIPIGWKIIVEPKAGKTESEGGIDVSVTQDAQEHLVYLGTIVAMGEAAFMTRTQGGLDMSKWKVRPQVGDHVIFSQYAGLEIHVAGDSPNLRLMNDTDLHALIDNLDEYYSWIDA